MKKHILLTGGGTAGHVTPNIALLPGLKELGYEISYVGSYDGIEKQLIEDMGIPYYGISSGKLRRYLSAKNATDVIRVLKGYSEAKKVIKQLQPDVVFSKGGFVTVPVVFAAKKLGIPAIIHESDITPGLANRLCIPRAEKVCCNFPETMKHLPEGKAVCTGTPIRKELMSGDAARGLEFCRLAGDLPVVMVIGGSLGAVAVNELVREALPELLKKYRVIHLCGKGNLDESLNGTPGYAQFEYIRKELPDLFAAADLVISRAGANAICEISSLAKPNLLIPLPAASSRGDQLLNAESFEKQGYIMVMQEETATKDKLLSAVDKLYEEREQYITAMKGSSHTDSIAVILDLIEEAFNKNA